MVEEEKTVHPGATMLGIVLTTVTGYSLYIEMFNFALFVIALLVVLALGSMVINKKYE
jgi:hypothetical protein